VQKFLGCKKNIRIVLGCISRDSSTNLFMKLKILPLPSQYIFSLLLFVIKNRNKYTVNFEIHHINTRQHLNFHQLPPSLINANETINLIGSYLMYCIITSGKSLPEGQVSQCRIVYPSVKPNLKIRICQCLLPKKVHYMKRCKYNGQFKADNDTTIHGVSFD
jgi:hypothetical protein